MSALPIQRIRWPYVIALVAALFLVWEMAWLRNPPPRARALVPDEFLEHVRGGSLPAPEFPDTASLTPIGQVDYAWRLQALDGRERALEEFRGQVIFINVWATWCGPCIAELPQLESLRQSLQNEPVEFIIVSEEDADTVNRFLARRNFDLPFYVSQALPKVFGSRGVPETFIVHRAGRIIFRHSGAANWNSDATRAFLHALISAKGGPPR